MKKKYVFPTIIESEYSPAETYAELTVPDFISIGIEDPIAPEDNW